MAKINDKLKVIEYIEEIEDGFENRLCWNDLKKIIPPIVGLEGDINHISERANDLDFEFSKMKFNSLYEKLTYRVESIYELIESTPISSVEMISLTRYLTPLKSYTEALSKLENTYVFSMGHVRRMQHSAIEVHSLPGSNWSVAGGLMADVMPSCEIGLYVSESAFNIYGSETQKEFSSENEFVPAVISSIAGKETKFEIKEIKENLVVVKSSEKGYIIGKGGSKIKLMESLIKKRIKLI